MNEKERMQAIAENITFYRKKHKLTQKELASRIGIKPSTMTDYMKLRSAPSFGVIQKLADFFGIQKSDIDTSFKEPSPPLSQESAGETLEAILSTSKKLKESRQLIVLDTAKNQLEEQEKAQKHVSEPFTSYDDNVIPLPETWDYDFYDHPASAGTGQYLNDVPKEIISLPVDIRADFVIPVYGDSMEPDYHSGDYVFVKLSVNLSDGDIGVFEYYGDAYIKQLIIEEDRAYLHSLNPKYDDIPIDASSDFRIIGEVVGKYRG